MKRKWLLWLIPALCVLVLAASAFYIFQQNRYDLTMTMNGNTVMAVELGQSFADPGATAQGHDPLHGNTEVSVTCQGVVDTNTLGIYRLSYRSEYHGKVCTGYRDVHVVKSLAPVITLIAAPDKYTLPNEPYIEEGYTATDWHDGDITHLVQRTEADGVVTYTVTNSAGLTATAERVIRYGDPVAPELVLMGMEDMTVPAGFPFAEPGYRAQDNVDGQITDRVQLEGNVNVYRPGTYQLTYSVCDTWGNVTTAVRNVTVETTMTNPAKSTGKVIYLTFDDGPGIHTERLLEILAKYDVKATFFLVNTDYIDLSSKIAEEGHAVAIHSATHKFSQIYASEAAYYDDLYLMQGIIAEHTGQTSTLLRFPGGSSNTISRHYNRGIMSRLVKSVEEKGFRYFDWNVDSNDAGGATTADEVFQNVIGGIGNRKEAVVLQHDIHGYSVDAVESIIIWGLANGYTFLPLDQNSPTCAHGTYN